MSDWIIKDLDVEDLKDMWPLLQEYEYKPYQYYRDLKNEHLIKYVIEDIGNTLLDVDENSGYLARDESNILGLATLKLLPWDKEIFNKEMATIPYLMAIGHYEQRRRILTDLLTKLIDECKKLGVEHLSVKVDTADLLAIHSLGTLGFKLMDILVTCSFDFSRSSIPKLKDHFKIRKQEEKDIESVVELARLSFQDYIDRFHSDPTLDNQSCDQLYAEWARNSCRGSVADEVFIAEMNGVIIGFATSKFHRDVNRFTDHKIGELVLSCVSPKARVGNLFTCFIHHVLSTFYKKVDFVQVVAHINNTFVQRACTKLGFRLINSRITFHKWL